MSERESGEFGFCLFCAVANSDLVVSDRTEGNTRWHHTILLDLTSGSGLTTR